MKQESIVRPVLSPFSALSVLLLLAPVICFETTAQSIGRPEIYENTLVDDHGNRLRGGTFWLYGWMPEKTDWALSPTPWNLIREHKFNIVRLTCAYRTTKANNYSLDRYQIILDSLVNMAERAGIYAIIDFHDTPGTYTMANARAFWNRFASRYKNRKNVIYELTNEPKFDQPESYTDQNLRDFEALWKICDTNAPETPIIILSFNQVGYSGRTPARVADSLRGIDWKKTLVGFHGYWRDASTRVVDLKNNYPCINTEFMCLIEGSNEMKSMDGYAYQGTLMEKLGISWLQWDILDNQASATGNLPKVIADLKKNDCTWTLSSGGEPIDTSVGEPSSDTSSVTPLVRATRNRPYISGNTLVSDKGTRLRGGTFWIYGWMPEKTDWALSAEPWDLMKENRFNAVRISCAYRTDKANNYSLDRYQDILDTLVSMADRAGVYAIIDFHDTPGTYNLDNAKAFWKRFSMRYKSCTNVVFELTNEPKFDQPDSYTEQNLRDFESLWKICDSNSPETPCIILSFNQVGYSRRTPVQVADSLRGIDWKKTLVGFHGYWRDASTRVVDLHDHYPCINTEFMCLTEGSNEMKAMDGYEYQGTLMEKLEISWLQWDILDQAQSARDKLPLVISDIDKNDVNWMSDGEFSTGQTTNAAIPRIGALGNRKSAVSVIINNLDRGPDRKNPVRSPGFDLSGKSRPETRLGASGCIISRTPAQEKR